MRFAQSIRKLLGRDLLAKYTVILVLVGLSGLTALSKPAGDTNLLGTIVSPEQDMQRHAFYHKGDDAYWADPAEKPIYCTVDRRAPMVWVDDEDVMTIEAWLSPGTEVSLVAQKNDPQYAALVLVIDGPQWGEHGQMAEEHLSCPRWLR